MSGKLTLIQIKMRHVSRFSGATALSGRASRVPFPWPDGVVPWRATMADKAASQPGWTKYLPERGPGRLAARMVAVRAQNPSLKQHRWYCRKVACQIHAT